jgi:hypothetical protein
MGGVCSTNGENRKACKLFVGMPGGKRLLGGLRHRWVDNINMDLLEIEWGDVDWIGLAQDRDRWRLLVNSVMNFGFYKMLGKYQAVTQVGACRVGLSCLQLVLVYIIRTASP